MDRSKIPVVACALAYWFETLAEVAQRPVENHGCDRRVFQMTVDDECQDGGIEIRCVEFEPGDAEIVIAALRAHAAGFLVAHTDRSDAENDRATFEQWLPCLGAYADLERLKNGDYRVQRTAELFRAWTVGQTNPYAVRNRAIFLRNEG